MKHGAMGWALLPLLLLGLGGCGTKKVPPTHYYTIDIHTPGIGEPNVETPRFGTLRIAMVHPTRLTNSSNIFYREKSHRLQPYAYSRWYETLGSMLENKLLLAFEKSRMAETVVGDVSGTRADARLEVAVLDAVHDFTGGKPSKARLVCTVTLLDNRTRESLASKLFEVEAAAPSDDAEGGVKALNEAADRMVAEILRWVASLPAQNGS